MYSLLLDSSNTSLAVGLEKEGQLVAFTAYEAWQRQSEHMIPEIDKILNSLHVKREDIDKIICAIGPGSYTGVRIALTIAKVASLCLEKPIYPVSSLRILKDDDKPSICLINARSNRSYFGVYKGNEIIIEDTIKNNDEVKEYISSHPDYSICGDARYLGYENKDTNVGLQMISLLKVLKKADNDLAVKPVYLKDQI